NPGRSKTDIEAAGCRKGHKPRTRETERQTMIAAVVVTHNRLSQLQITVARLLAESVDHIFVYDNASEDGTGDWLAGQAGPRLSFHRSDVNRGGAGGFAHAMAEVAQGLDPDWLLVMDDDGRPVP